MRHRCVTRVTDRKPSRNSSRIPSRSAGAGKHGLGFLRSMLGQPDLTVDAAPRYPTTDAPAEREADGPSVAC
jgi:hypothetical protein